MGKKKKAKRKRSDKVQINPIKVGEYGDYQCTVCGYKVIDVKPLPPNVKIPPGKRLVICTNPDCEFHKPFLTRSTKDQS